jgi:trehalose-6-phosphate synthase
MRDLDVDDIRQRCESLQTNFFANRALIIAANRGPVTFETAEDESLQSQRGEGGLVTALLGLCRHTDATWIACAQTVLNWRKRFLERRSEGPVAALMDLPRSGRPPITTSNLSATSPSLTCTAW